MLPQQKEEWINLILSHVTDYATEVAEEVSQLGYHLTSGKRELKKIESSIRDLISAMESKF